MRMAPGASLTDGQAHLLIVRRAPRPLLVPKLALLGSGRHIEQQQVTFVPANTITVHAERPLGLQSDGDVIGYSPCRVTLVPAAIGVLAP